jgi:hypothetical protein
MACRGTSLQAPQPFSSKSFPGIPIHFYPILALSNLSVPYMFFISFFTAMQQQFAAILKKSNP